MGPYELPVKMSNTNYNLFLNIVTMGFDNIMRLEVSYAECREDTEKTLIDLFNSAYPAFSA